MYLRFVTYKLVMGMASREGFFQAAGAVADDPLLDPMARKQLDELRHWFGTHLDTPKRFTKSKSKGSHLKETKGLSWFKPSATEHISKAFELKFVLEENGYYVEVLKENRIGYVVYEDEYQVVAEPFSETSR